MDHSSKLTHTSTVILAGKEELRLLAAAIIGIIQVSSRLNEERQN